LADGRHRLMCAQELNVKEIPVSVVYCHPDYKFDKLDCINDLLIPKYIYKLIVSQFPSDVPLYQEYTVLEERFLGMKEFLSKLTDCNVLEIGCNASLLTWSIMKYAKSYLGLDTGEYYRQAKVTIDCLQSLWKDKKVNVAKGGLNGGDFDTLFLSYVLYWLSDEELDILEKEVLPKCKQVLILNRTKERTGMKNSRLLNRDINVMQFLNENGFNITMSNYPTVKVKGDTHYKHGFSVFMGEK